MKLAAVLVVVAGVTVAQVPLDVPVAVVSVSREDLEAVGRTDVAKYALLVAADPPPAGTGKPLGDRVRLDLIDGVRGTASVLPQGWSARMDGKTLIAEGPAVESITIRYDVGKDLEKLIGKTCRFRMSLNGRDVLNQQITVQWKTNPPVGDLNYPPIVTAGQPYWSSWEGSLAPFEGLTVVGGGSTGRNSFGRSAFMHWDDREFFTDIAKLVTPPALPQNEPQVIDYSLIGLDRWREGIWEKYMRQRWVPPEQCTPGVTGGDRLAFAGQNACVAGCFGSLGADAKALAAILDGKTELQAKAGSPNAFVFRIPADTTPGEHTIELKGAASGTFKIGVLGVQGSIDQNVLMKGGSTEMKLRVLGSDEKLPLQITNATPSTIRIDNIDGPVYSPGGANNEISRTVTGIRKGNFKIDYKLNLPSCGVVPPR